MNPTHLFLASTAILGAFCLAAGPSNAEPYRPAPTPTTCPAGTGRKIYPYSPYNYGRNPYNPAIYPYPPPYYPPYYAPEDSSLRTYPMYGPGNASAPDGPAPCSPRGWARPCRCPTPPASSNTRRRERPSYRSASPTHPPTSFSTANAPIRRGQHAIFITPELPDGKTCHYTVSASWKAGGDDVTRKREVGVSAGHTTVIDFTRAEKK